MDRPEYPNKGAGALSKAERARLLNITNYDAQQLALAIVTQAITALSTQSNEHIAVARQVGFENAEHEVLAFLSSDWFDLLLSVICTSDNSRSPIEFAQEIVDRAYGPGKIKVVPRELPDEILRRDGPKGYKYVDRISDTARPGTGILEVYNDVLRQEIIQPDCIVIEVTL